MCVWGGGGGGTMNGTQTGVVPLFLVSYDWVATVIGGEEIASFPGFRGEAFFFPPPESLGTRLGRR